MGAARNAVLLLVLTISVRADGPGCSQAGFGPPDMMMSNGDMNPKYMWAKQRGIVKIPIVLDHAYSHKERRVIFGGLAEMASKTCVKFFVFKHPSSVPGGSYVYITKSKGKGCWSYVGKQGGHQDLSLPRGCINHRTVMHEMMHALGFSHEHVRADRDKYVAILWENVQRGRERNFRRKHDSKSDKFGPYDYESIMHYDAKAFSRNGYDTIRPLQGYVRIGKGRRMSHWDVKKINRAYKCHGHSHSPNDIFGGFGYGGDHPPENYPEDSVNFVPDHSYRRNPFYHPDGPGPQPPSFQQPEHAANFFDRPPPPPPPRARSRPPIVPYSQSYYDDVLQNDEDDYYS